MPYFPATFDLARFDQSYFDITDSSYGQFLSAGDELIDDDGEDVTLIKVSNTLDTEGRVTASSETSDTGVRVKIQPISERNRRLVGRGASEEGTMLLFAKRSYDLTNNGDGTRIEPGDKVTRSGISTDTYRVETLVGKKMCSGGDVYHKFIIKRVGA